jgi:capsular polysaccharide transport system permease protein|nr:ABC transporter permease [Panacagrimonas sp.]
MMRGALSGFRGRRLLGWAYAPGQPPPTVEILLNGAVVGQAVADAPRPDLRLRLEHPTGRCGFEFEFPEGEVQEGDLIEARVPGCEVAWTRNPCKVLLRGPSTFSLEPVPHRKLDVKPDGPALIPDFGVLPGRPRPIILRDVLRALFLREVRNRYGAHRFGYFWAVAQPIILVMALQVVHVVLRKRGDGLIYGVDGMYFFLLGVLPWFMFANGYHQCMGAMKANRGMYTYRQVQPIDIILIRCTLAFVIQTIALVVIVTGFYWSGRPISLAEPAAYLAMLTLLYLFTMSVGLIVDVFVTRNDDVRNFLVPVDRVLLFISGVFFTLDAMPRELHPYLLWNPLLHAFELGRAAMLEQYETPCSWGYLSICTVVAMTLALTLYRRNLFRLTS